MRDRLSECFAAARCSFRVEAYVWALNVFDNRNATAVYTSTGVPTSTNWLDTDDGQAFLAAQGDEGLRRYEVATNNPNLYSNPRLVRFGLRTSF